MEFSPLQKADCTDLITLKPCVNPLQTGKIPSPCRKGSWGHAVCPAPTGSGRHSSCRGSIVRTAIKSRIQSRLVFRSLVIPFWMVSMYPSVGFLFFKLHHHESGSLEMLCSALLPRGRGPEPAQLTLSPELSLCQSLCFCSRSGTKEEEGRKCHCAEQHPHSSLPLLAFICVTRARKPLNIQRSMSH